ncbi:MAG: glucose-1-phosphate thymidylyltransferase [Bacteroidetes bacterium]|nr:MAG: glucose-1-phosphate thymidylyltransferase [Bacteroidota bacterium]PTM13253.1 MAG: glucose-1-phosphate thymidylyltransferase [Bacteroidota bacterium]
MMHLVLFDNEIREQLLPLTFLRPVGALRVGILTIQEKWERTLACPVSFLTQDYLSDKYEMDYGEENLLINGSLLPTPQMVRLIQQMEFSDALLLNGELLAAKLTGKQIEQLIQDKDFGDLTGYEVNDTEVLKLSGVYDIFQLNQAALELDFQLITAGRKSAPLSASNRLIGPAERLFIEKGAEIECAILNTKNGPIYIGRNALVMEGAMIRGAFAMGEDAVIKMGAKIYGATTLGPGCKVGGEVNNSVLQANSNKGHDGYLGNSVLGEWCNIGADTNCSNLKNTYEEVKLWNYPAGRFLGTGLQFCGLILADHVKVGINTMFNTGTVVGVAANVFGTGFPRNFIPSFSWGGPQGLSTYRTAKAFAMMERVLERRQQELSVQDRLILLRVFEDTAQYRSWDK